MPRTKSTSRSASGNGTIRKKTVTRKGKEYTYWEARVTVGYDPGTGKQIQKSISGKTQKEVAQKLRQVTAEIDQGTYKEPCKMTLGQWADIWVAEYLGGVKPRTLELYQNQMRLYIKPALGAVKLEVLTPHIIQQFYNGLSRQREDKSALSPKSVRNIHGILHRCLQQAVLVGYIRVNPADVCTLPRVEKRELHPLEDGQTAAFLKAIRGDVLEQLFIVALFTGMREGELLGLAWDAVDFQAGIITVRQQLSRRSNGAYVLASPKNGKPRTLTPAPTVMTALKRQRSHQAEQQLKAGPLWEDSGLVFTNAQGHYLSPRTVYDSFKRIAARIGCPDTRVHDLRHTYAVNALRAGDDVKTVQGNLGHATAAFTLDIYGHVTGQMKEASAARMESFIKTVSGL